MAKETSSTDVVRAFLAAYDRHDLSAMLQTCSEDARLCYVPMGPQGQGLVREAGRRIWGALLEAFPDLHVAPQAIFGDDKQVAAEVTLRGTQDRRFLDIPSQGRPFELEHAFIFRMADGRIQQITAYWDNVSFYEQLGQQLVAATVSMAA